eukprot:jgi/Tetstr1/421283/TSEL_001156.t1
MVQRIRLDAVDDELDFRTSSIQQPTPQEPFHATPADCLEGDDEEDDPPLGLPTKSPSHAAFINPRDWIDYMPRAYAESMPRPVGLTNPGLWNPRNDEWGRYLTDEKNHATRCRHMLPAHLPPAFQVQEGAYRRAQERVAERLVYSRFFDTAAAERSSNGVDGLLDTPDDDSRSASTWRPRRMPPRSSRAAAAEGAEAAAAATSASRSKSAQNTKNDRATKKRADKNKDKDKIKGKPLPGNHARKTTTPQAEEQNRRWRGAHILLAYVDDFLLFSASMEHLRQRPASLLDALGLQRNPTKGFREPCQFGMHLGVDIDSSASGMLHAPADHCCPAEFCSAATYNGGHRSPVSPTASLCTDSSGYGWGGVLNGMLEAQGFWSLADERQHIIWEELKAVRLVVENFLPHLAGRDVLLHKDNKAMQQSGVAASVVTPRWEGKAWHHALAEMAVEELTVAPHAGLFRPGRRNGRGMIGKPH